MNYSVIIRAHQATPLLVRAIRCLHAQSFPPHEIIVVDSSGNPAEQAKLKALADVHVVYSDGAFNYSRAIQVGVNAASARHVLVHSAHVAVVGPQLIERAFAQAEAGKCPVFYFRKGDCEVFDVIDAIRFDGRNGLANSCAMIPRALLLERGFRDDVFSAEDQEWAAWFIRERRGLVLRVTSPECLYDNPHLNIQKKINEDLAIACFVNRQERWPHRILIRFGRAVLAFLRRRPDRARLHWGVVKGLLHSYVSKPRRNSRYF